MRVADRNFSTKPRFSEAKQMSDNAFRGEKEVFAIIQSNASE